MPFICTTSAYHGPSSLRQLKSKIKEWGAEKNLKASDMETLLAKREKRKHDSGLDTVFLYHGATLEEDKLERFSKRKKSHSSVRASPSNRK